MKSGFVAIAGRPNVGKSTLVNALCGGKVAIVSDKPQTTRRRIFGIANGPEHQLVLADLPGFQRPRDLLTEHLQRTVDRAFEEMGENETTFLEVAKHFFGGLPCRGNAKCSEKIAGLASKRGIGRIEKV